MKGLIKDFFDFSLLCLYYRLFIRPRLATKAAPEWELGNNQYPIIFNKIVSDT
jgi:hypothetical protein